MKLLSLTAAALAAATVIGVSTGAMAYHHGYYGPYYYQPYYYQPYYYDPYYYGPSLNFRLHIR